MTSGFSPAFDDASFPPEPFNDSPPEPTGRYSSSRSDQGNNYGEFRTPPQDREAEEGVLGAMLLSREACDEVMDILKPDDFYVPRNRTIYEAILKVLSNEGEIDPLILSGQLDRQNDLERVGGAAYLHQLVASVPSAANSRFYAEMIAEKAVFRSLVSAGTRVVQLGYEGLEDAEVDAVVDMAQQEVFAVGKRQTADDYDVLGNLLGPTIDTLTELQQHGGQQVGVPTGFIDLDELTNGLRGGQMIIIAARPGVGKSTLAMDFMREASIRHGKTSVIFSLEMSSEEIVMRILSAEAEVKLSDMRGGKVSTEDWQKLVASFDALEKAPLYIDDSPTLTMMEIRSKARKLSQTHGLDLVVLDYMQLLSSGRKVESRQQEVSEFSRQLKLLAKELDVPVIAISQLNRGPESRTDKKPQLADLRESGSLEQDADMVMLLYRPDSQDRDNERAGEADIILAKHRGGPIDTVQVAHQLHYSKFVNMARG